MTVLASIAAFKGIDPADLARIEAKSRTIEPHDGMLIFAQGAVADAVYVIIGGEGHVRIGATNRSSKGMMIEIFRTGDMFGEIGVIDGSARTADAGAVGRLELLRIGSQVFLEALDAHSALAANLCRILSARLRRTFDLLQDATFESLEVRLARQILYLAKRGGRRTAQGQQLTGRFRQNDLADLLGATTRSIITILNAWRASGLVVYDPARAQLTLSREDELQALIGDPAQALHLAP